MIKLWTYSSQIEINLLSWVKVVIIFYKHVKSGISILSSIWGKKEVETGKSILLNQQLQNPLKIKPKETD